ncbi:MAG: ABC transporter [Cytophagales bacterium CG18_big_fil_WC_8_21_14_2_50_42_9]|nr:MAG: ABC transporter [Cytophagales bacterium CG18_big_fil_WC_8_21_14_2_50_42_9]
MLHFAKFRKSYGSYLALAIEDLTILSGIYWIKGVNGSGKSTLLKTMAGILYFDGDISINKQISLKNQAIAYRQLVNFAEAEPIFPEFLTGKELVQVFAAAKNAPTGQEDYYIESMHLQPYLNQPVSTYSSGMLKKLSLVLAFMGKPRIILLDEPLITLDQAALNIFYKWIAREHQQNKTSFFISSHQALEPEALPTAKEILLQAQTLHFIS